jgi:hypothetical protein
MQELNKIQAARQVCDALRHRNGPDTEPLYDLTIGSQVIVWRIHEKAWKGPYQLLSLDNENAVVAIGRRRTTFRSTSVRPYCQSEPENGLISPETLEASTSRARSGPNPDRPGTRPVVEIPYCRSTRNELKRRLSVTRYN